MAWNVLTFSGIRIRTDASCTAFPGVKKKRRSSSLVGNRYDSAPKKTSKNPYRYSWDKRIFTGNEKLCVLLFLHVHNYGLMQQPDAVAYDQGANT